ncbi:MAG TPA: sugar phosphate isomerase/epimerase family protein [Cyclobacteriaceae bacterium]|nr:sugar phosphate isomerase/epimerase family protein [Cyclobacteriaceae bacterium]
MKFALLSVTYSGLFYAGKPMTIEQQIRKAKSLGFEALAIETKRPIASPIDISKKERERIKSVAADEGIALCALESMSNFCSRHMEDRENNLAMMKLTLEMAKDLGIDKVKVFAAWPGIINDEEAIASYAPYDRGNYFKPVNASDLRVWNRAIEGIREVADWASDMGITLLLQNHAPVLTPGYEDTLAMLNELDRKNIELCLDVPLFFDRQKTEYVKEAVEKCRDYISYTHYGAWNFRENADGEIEQEPAPTHGGKINYETFIEQLQNIGYDGYLVSEYCLPMIRNHKIAGVEEIDRATKMAMVYMKDLIARTAPVAVR